MDVFNKVSSTIKKKLTLQDYASMDSLPAGQHDSMEICQQPAATAQEPSSGSLTEIRSELPMQENRPGLAKIKATFYLTQDDNQRLMDIYIKNLQLGKKIDKSALVAAAIQLLAKKYNV